MKKTVLAGGALALLALAACAPVRPTVITTPAAGPTSLTFAVVACKDAPVDNHCPTPIAGAKVIVGDNDAQGNRTGTTNADGYLEVTVLDSLVDSYVLIDADGFDHFDSGTIHPAQLAGKITFFTLKPSIVRRFPAESGAVHVCGAHFCDDQNRTWAWRGASMFRLFGRHHDGDDITPDVRKLVAYGINVIRVWPQWEAKAGGADHLERAADFRDKLASFLDLCAREGLRVEITAIVNWQSPDQDRPTVQAIYDVAAGRWNVFVEAVNEPWVKGYDVVRLMQGVDRHGIISAYGYNVDAGANGWTTIAALDYLTPHTPRDLAHYPRNSKDLMEMRDALHLPIVDDEPLGIAEYDNEGSGARSTDFDAHLSHFAVCALYAAGCTIHSQAGLDGHAPTAAEPITDRIFDAIGRTWLFIPNMAINGSYARNGLGDFPLSVNAGDVYDNQGHAYASVLGNIAYVVVPKPTSAWIPRPIAGWSIDAVGPTPYILAMHK